MVGSVMLEQLAPAAAGNRLALARSRALDTATLLGVFSARLRLALTSRPKMSRSDRRKLVSA